MSEKEILRQELQNLGGKVFIAMVHPHFYGPLRNLNFILENPNVDELDEYLRQQQTQIKFEIWQATMLAVTPMIMPWEMSLTCEKKPKSFKTIQEAEDHIRKLLKENKAKDKDLYYYRVGIV